MSRNDPPDSSEGTGRELRLAIANDLALVCGANDDLEAFLRRWNLKSEVIYSAVLALEEVVTNIIKYAYTDAATHEIHIEALIGEEEVVLRFTDDGQEFDLRSATPPHLDKPPEERPPGGLGIHLVRSIARRIEYVRAEGRNTLLLSIALNP
jgi:anti-sigma regulatory factor (Ser/Thr protein kinase)